MTRIQLTELLLSPDIDEMIKKLSVSSFAVPEWTDLVKEYEPSLHKIWDTTLYPAKQNENGGDDFKRTAFGLQKLAVNRISQALFSTPVERVYSYEENEKNKAAVEILEQLYKIDNYIDAENLERAKKLNAACQIVTIWKTYEEPSVVNGETTKYKLTHKTYSEKEGYKIYTQLDENNQILVVAIFYTVTAENKNYCYVYINGDKKEFRSYVKADKWVLDESIVPNPKPLEFFPLVYTAIESPVWGGVEGTILVEQLEEMESFDGLYIKKNSAPTFTLDYGDVTNTTKDSKEETSSDSRRIIVVGKGGSMQDVTWPGAGESVSKRIARIRNAFFEQVQMPDISFANMLNSNTSAENKELLFSDAKAKAADLGGEWSKMFMEEINVVKNFAKIMFPTYSAEFDAIKVRSVVHPYSVNSKKENAEIIATAGDAMSLSTKVAFLGVVDNVQQEVELIESANSAEANQGL